MTDLLLVLPDLDVAPFTHILPSLERARICTADLITLDASDVARRAQVPPGEVKTLAIALLADLHKSIIIEQPLSSGSSSQVGGADGSAHDSDVIRRCSRISTLDDGLDAALGGGFSLGHLTEIVGESAVGKTQLLLTLLLSFQLSGDQSDPRRNALYISTEAPLQTSRLTQILKCHPKLASLSPAERPSLSRIQSTHVHDLESQEHILRYQVPAAIQKLGVGLLIVDSIAANYRAEYDKGEPGRKTAESLARRNVQLAQMGHLLRNLARQHRIAVVVANQVADRFATIEPVFPMSTQSTQGARSDSPARPLGQGPSPHHLSHGGWVPPAISSGDPLALDHQQRFFTGWGNDLEVTNLKTPTLGLTWTNQLAARIALLKEPVYDRAPVAPGEERNLIGWKRSCNVVFSAWSAESKTEYEIWEGGIRSIGSASLEE